MILLSIPTGIDLRGHEERMGGIAIELKLRRAVNYIRDKRRCVAAFGGGL